jgi:hypothetical protein
VRQLFAACLCPGPAKVCTDVCTARPLQTGVSPSSSRRGTCESGTFSVVWAQITNQRACHEPAPPTLRHAEVLGLSRTSQFNDRQVFPIPMIAHIKANESATVTGYRYLR